MSSITTTAELDECTAPLDQEGRRALRRYWDRVIREEWVPPVVRVVRAVTPVEGSGRQGRETRRAMARVAAAGRLAPVVALRPTTTAAGIAGAAGSGVAA